MTRAHVLIGAAISSTALMAGARDPAPHQRATATCADRPRQMQAVNLARHINSAEINSRTGVQPLSAFPNVVVSDGFSVQFTNDSATCQFSVKDTQDPCHFCGVL